MKKKWILAAAAGLVLSMCVMVNAMAAEGEWVQESGNWKYRYEDGTELKSCWRQIDGFWYHFDRNGYMAVDWTTISGTDYFFHDDGRLGTGWRYNDMDETWHYFCEDGTFRKGWYQENGEWYWFSSRGVMTGGGYRSIEGKKYYFFEDGRMASNQYVGTYFMNQEGERDETHDMRIEGDIKASQLEEETKEEITEALSVYPGAWIKDFLDHGWQFIYYPEREYFSAPDSYYIYHKLDSSYRKIKFCRPDALRTAFAEYIGYASGAYEDGSSFAGDLAANIQGADELVEVPGYYRDDLKFYFGKLMEMYLDENMRPRMEETIPEICEDLKNALYSKQSADNSQQEAG